MAHNGCDAGWNHGEGSSINGVWKDRVQFMLQGAMAFTIVDEST